MKPRVIQDEPEPSEPGVPGDVEAAPHGRPTNRPEDGSASGGDDDAAEARAFGDLAALEPEANGGAR